jgi:hypothetical protein
MAHVVQNVDAVVPLGTRVPDGLTRDGLAQLLATMPELLRVREATTAVAERVRKQEKAFQRLGRSLALDDSSLVEIARARALQMAAGLDKLAGYLAHRQLSIHHYSNDIGAFAWQTGATAQ